MSNITIFQHPSTIISPSSISSMRDRVYNKKISYSVTAAQRLASNAKVDHVPSPVPSVNCRWNGPQIGHEQLNVKDAPMAWMCVLQFLMTNDQRFANTAIRIIRAWCDVCTECIGENRNLEASWSQINFCRSLEMLKYTWSGFSNTGIETIYNRWIDRVMLPAINSPINWKIYNGDAFGNWQASICEANMQIAVFRDNRRLFDKAISDYKTILPVIIKPSGLNNEILRDLCHASMSQGALLHCCEIVHHATNGRVDLFAEQNNLIVRGMEYLAAIHLGQRNFPEIAGKKINLDDQVWPQGSWQLGYQSLALRKKQSMPFTKRLIEQRSPVWHWLCWGHGNLIASR